MLVLVALWGFLGGLLRAAAGYLEYGKPNKRKIPPGLLITGFVGIVSVFAVFYLEASLMSLAGWKLALAAGLAGYVGTDILNSLFEILRQRGLEGREPC